MLIRLSHFRTHVVVGPAQRKVALIRALPLEIFGVEQCLCVRRHSRHIKIRDDLDGCIPDCESASQVINARLSYRPDLRHNLAGLTMKRTRVHPTRPIGTQELLLVPHRREHLFFLVPFLSQRFVRHFRASTGFNKHCF
jgi:hypothetical protein